MYVLQIDVSHNPTHPYETSYVKWREVGMSYSLSGILLLVQQRGYTNYRILQKLGGRYIPIDN